MTSPNWDSIPEVDVPRGAFIGWGDAIGQHVTGKVLDYSPAGGTDANGNVCPQLSIELLEPAASFNRTGQRTDHPAGELVILNCGLVSLKRAVQVADLDRGDLVKITLSGLVPTGKGTVKEMSIKVARGSGQSAAPANAAPQAQAPFQQQASPAFGQQAPAATPPF